MATQNENNIFINGKSQILEMLKYMNPDECERLIKNVRLRNPQLADEMLSNSITLEILDRFEDQDISFISSFVNPTIMGLALKISRQQLQRRILGAVPREYAEKTYSVMMSNVRTQIVDAHKAQEKVIRVIADLIKKKQLKY